MEKIKSKSKPIKGNWEFHIVRMNGDLECYFEDADNLQDAYDKINERLGWSELRQTKNYRLPIAQVFCHDTNDNFISW